VAGLIGENGAGKSTLVNILSGIIEPNEGSIELDGQPFRPAGYREASTQGVARVFQEQALIPRSLRRKTEPHL
jgi:ABC-type sugar transport system ATPase subunit